MAPLCRGLLRRRLSGLASVLETTVATASQAGARALRMDEHPIFLDLTAERCITGLAPEQWIATEEFRQGMQN